MRYLTILIFILLTGCDGGSSDSEPPTDTPNPEPTPTTVTSYANQSTWYSLGEGEIPKYSGVMGTYTAKHLPIAVSCSMGDFATYSNNQSGELEIHVISLDSGEDALIRKLPTIDPHQNAAIQCVENKLRLSISARHNSKVGYHYESTDGTNWSLIGEHQRSYPQLHNLNGELIELYTKYKKINGIVARQLYSSCNDELIVKDDYGHYSVSYYDGDSIHVVYNTHYRGSDYRTELWHTQSKNGCEWSEPVKWLDDSELTYVKDLNKVNGELTALVVRSSSPEPDRGERNLVKVTKNGWKAVSETNHNYTTGALMNDGAVLTPTGYEPYAGGEFMGMPYVNYIRRVHGADKRVVLSEGISHKYKSDAWLVGIEF